MINHWNELNQIKLFVLDMDGTFYLGNQIIKGSLEFINKVKETGRDFLFFTNNSSKSGKNYVEKLKGMNCFIKESQILTSGDVTIAYLKRNHGDKRIYLVGTPALRESFLREGLNLTEDEPDAVVVAFDTTITYEKLEKACSYIRKGAVFLATHPDINCPTEEGFMPDCGAICAAIALSTGVKPKYLGKPYKETIQMIMEKTGYKRNEIAFVGDRLYTDIAAGVNHQANGILVLTGETKEEDLKISKIRPSAVFDSLFTLSIEL